MGLAVWCGSRMVVSFSLSWVGKGRSFLRFSLVVCIVITIASSSSSSSSASDSLSTTCTSRLGWAGGIAEVLRDEKGATAPGTGGGPSAVPWQGRHLPSSPSPPSLLISSFPPLLSATRLSRCVASTSWALPVQRCSRALIKGWQHRKDNGKDKPPRHPSRLQRTSRSVG